MQDPLARAARASFAPERARRSLEHLAESSPSAREGLERAGEAFLKHLADLILISPPMLESLTGHPEWIGWLGDNLSREMKREGKRPESSLEAWREWRAQAGRAADAIDLLRAFKRREYLKISCLDVSGLISFEETVGRLSNLADLMIAEALS